MKKDETDHLDEEIESAVDSLFVELGIDGGKALGGREKGIPQQGEQIPDISPEMMEESIGKDEFEERPMEPPPAEEEMASPPEAEIVEEDIMAPPEVEPVREEAPLPPEPAPAEKPPGKEKLPKGLEALEVEVLSLEWEFSPETLKRIIAALGGLKAAYRDDESLLKVVDMMGKVSLYLLNDEKSITPDALRFLQDGKEVIKYLTTERGEQGVFTNLVAEGINSHFQLLGLGGQSRKEKPPDQVLQKLCSDLEKHRMRLHDGEDRLGRVLNRVRGMKEELIFDDGIRGLSDELEKIHGSLRGCLDRLGETSGQFQREILGKRLYGVEKVLLVEAHNRFFGIPAHVVLKSYTLSDGYARSIGAQDSITIRGRKIPLIKLSGLFNLGGTGAGRSRGVVLAGQRDQIIAVLVDRVLRNKDLLVSTAEQEKRGSRYLTGVSRLESGKMVYILNIEPLKARGQS
jgi:hypothetical protein